MDYQQIVQPNLNIIGRNGYCLAYVEDVFGTPHIYPNATTGWAEAQYKHTELPPSNISVPIWFSFNDPDGHVCVWANGVIHTTTANGMRTFTNIQALLNFMNNGTINEHMVYLGWSEDLANVRIVEGVTMETMNKGDVFNGFAIFKKTPTEDDYNVWVGQTFKEFQYKKIAPEVAAMPTGNFKPYDGKQLFVEG